MKRENTSHTDPNPPEETLPESHAAPPSHHRHHGSAHAAPPKASRRRVLTAWIGGAFFFIALIAVGALPRLNKNRKLTAAAEKVRVTAPAVNVVTPKMAANSGDLLLPSNVQAIEETTINARTSGYLKKRFVDIGSQVKAGQLLALIESPEADQQVLQAEADTAKARASSGQAQADVVRQAAAVAQTRSELARSQSNLEQVKADLEHQTAKLEQATSAVESAKAKWTQTRQNLEGRKADLQHAQAQFALARKTLDRWRDLEKVDAVSGQEVDEKQAAFEVSQANVSAAQAAVSSAQADVEAAQAAYLSSQADVRAAQADVKSGNQKVNAAQAAVLSSKANVEAAQSSVTASRANVEAMQASVHSSDAAMRRYAALQAYERVVAPFSGVITARNVDAGALITAGGGSGESDPTRTVPHSGLFGIARTDTLRIQVNVPQTFVSSIKPGQKARILFSEYPGRVFTGTVFRTAGALDAASRTLLAEIHLPNPQNTLLPGMFAQVQLNASHARPILRIPASALIVDAAGTRVATVTPEQKIHFVSVKAGRDYGSEVEISTGLEGNERLVSNPNDDLLEGTSVRVMETPK